jgi:uracil phosphoribosyltransferase
LLTIIELSVSIALELTIRHTTVIVNRKNLRIVMLYDRATDVTVRSTLLKTVLTPTKCALIVAKKAIYSVNVLRPTMTLSEITYTRFEKEDRRRWKTLRINRKYQI